MAQQSPDLGQRHTGRSSDACIAVAQVVEPDVFEPGGLAKYLPGTFEIDQRTPRLSAGNDERVVFEPRYHAQQFQGIA